MLPAQQFGQHPGGSGVVADEFGGEPFGVQQGVDRCGVLAVVTGEGMAELYRSLGFDAPRHPARRSTDWRRVGIRLTAAGASVSVQRPQATGRPRSIPVAPEPPGSQKRQPGSSRVPPRLGQEKPASTEILWTRPPKRSLRCSEKRL